MDARFIFKYSSKEQASKVNRLCIEQHGICPDNSEVKYENLDDVFNRAKNALLRYSNYNKIIVVTHGIVMRRFTFDPNIPFCGIKEIDFDESFPCTEFRAY